MTSTDLKKTSKEYSSSIETVRPNTSMKVKLKGGSLNDNFEIDDTNLDKNIKMNNLDCLNGNSNSIYL